MRSLLPTSTWSATPGSGCWPSWPTGSDSPGRWASSRAQAAAGPAATSQPGATRPDRDARRRWRLPQRSAPCWRAPGAARAGGVDPDRLAGGRTARADRRAWTGGLRAARAAARARAWRAGAAPTGRLVLDLDATLIDAHTDRKQGAAGSYKHTFGFHPLACYLDRGDGRGEALAGILRPGNAGANDAADQVAVLELALAQLPTRPRGSRRVLVPSDSAGATGEFVWHLHQRRLRFSVGLPIDAHVREAVLSLPAAAWMPAIDADGRRRDGAWVAEATGWLDLTAWPPGTRVICRKERPHPGAKPRFVDTDGNRYQVFATDQSDRDLARLELRHRRHARVEDRIRAAKATGLANLPFDAWRRNAVWLELVLCAQDLTCWAQTLLLDGELALAEPKRLRTRLLHTAGRLVAHARRLILRLPAAWPWAAALATAFARLRTLLPPPGRPS